MFEDGLLWSSCDILPSIDRGWDDASSASRSNVDLLLEVLPPRLRELFASSIDRKVGLKLADEAVAGGDAGVNRSCSALVALRMQMVLPISETVSET